MQTRGRALFMEMFYVHDIIMQIPLCSVPGWGAAFESQQLGWCSLDNIRQQSCGGEEGGRGRGNSWPDWLPR